MEQARDRIRTCISPISTACLVAAVGCSGEPAREDASTYDDCPEAGTFEFSLEWAPGPGWSTSPITSSGTVVDVMEDPPGTLTVSIDFLSGDHAPGVHVFQVPLTSGSGIDLFPDDEVTVSTQDLTACLGCHILELSIEREGEVILYALECYNEICNEEAFEVGPLRFSTVTGRCEPWKDPSGQDWWCTVKEHGGLEVGCPGGPEDQVQEIFRGQQATVECGATYRVSAGWLQRVLQGPSEGTFCADDVRNVRQLLVIRDGDGPGGHD